MEYTRAVCHATRYYLYIVMYNFDKKNAAKIYPTPRQTPYLLLLKKSLITSSRYSIEGVISNFDRHQARKLQGWIGFLTFRELSIICHPLMTHGLKLILKLEFKKKKSINNLRFNEFRLHFGYSNFFCKAQIYKIYIDKFKIQMQALSFRGYLNFKD